VLPGGVASNEDAIKLWDHPEPNYIWSPAIAEFWSVISAIPLAGSMLIYIGFRLKYPSKVVMIYFSSFWMYNVAMHSHLTLSQGIFEVTLTSVMWTAIITFYCYAQV